MIPSPITARAVSLAACLAYIPAGLSASIVEPDWTPREAPGHIDQLTRVDALGFECIEEDKIDLAFHMTGKGIRLPRTCLPEPCEAALTPVVLASLIGRPADVAEWEDYYSRYADVCRKEITSFADTELPEEAPEYLTADARKPIAFWAPLIATYPEDAPIREALLTRVSGAFGGSGPSGTPVSLRFDDPADPNFPRNLTTDPDDGKIIPNPLPPTIWLLLGAFAAVIGLRKRRNAGVA